MHPASELGPTRVRRIVTGGSARSNAALSGVLQIHYRLAHPQLLGYRVSAPARRGTHTPLGQEWGGRGALRRNETNDRGLPLVGTVNGRAATS